MTNLSPASCPFTIGSAVPHKNIKKTQPANLGGMPITCGTLLHKRPLTDAETERRAEYDRRADYARRVEIARADYDRRVEMARRDEYDRRREYDLSMLCQRKMSTAEDFELQVRRLDEMGKIIDTLTTMLTKPPQPQGAATEETRLGFARASKEVLDVRHFVKINRKMPHPSREQVEAVAEVGGFERAHETELLERKILKIRRKTEEEEKIENAAESAAAKVAAKEAETAEDKKQRQNKQVRTLARVLRTSDPKIRTKIKYNNNGGKTEGVSILGGVMSLKICMYSTRREKMKLGTLATKRASKQGQNIRLSASRMKATNEYKDWWKRLTTSKRNWKRKSLKGSTDVYLLKRTIELEID
jgi:hypothetical protein